MFLELTQTHYILIIVGVVIVGIILYFSFKPKKETAKEIDESKPEEVKVVKEEVITPPEPKKEEKAVVKEEVVITEKKEEVKVVSKPEKEVVKEEPKPAEADSAVKEVKVPKYHVSQNKDEKSDHFKEWRIRKEGSNKTIKFFATQKEAIEYAEDLATKAGSSVVIHKVDGSIRKQDYTKKEE